MASGSSGRVNSGSTGFDFGSDDVLCSHEDYGNQDSSNGPLLDHSTGTTNPNKEFHKTRMARSPVFPSSSYSPPEDSLSQDITTTVERTMKKYADNMMRFLEGISSRLSQLELYCYNLDKTIGEMRSDLTREHEEADVKLRSMEKHLQEVHRSVQILRDKQELAETQKELAKLQHTQKDSSSSSHSQHGEEGTPTPVSSDTHNQQLALALPHQVAPQPQAQLQPQPEPQPPQQYYMPPATQLSNLPAPAPNHAPAPVPPPQSQQLPAQAHSQQLPAQGQFVSPPPAPSQSSSAQPAQPFSQYQQMWQPAPMQQQQGPPQPQLRPQSSGPYPTYSPAPPSNQPPVEMLPNSIPMHPSYPGPALQSMPAYGYNASGRTAGPLQPSQQIKTAYSPQQGSDGYLASGPPVGPGSGYGMYEGGRMHYPPPQQQQQQQRHVPQSGYSPQQTRYGELVEKLVSMGFRGERAVRVIQRMEDSGEAIDFNAVIDRLSVESSSGGPQRGW